ncbi:MAG: protein SCO1/2 [Enterobacterales bacterium]
MKINKLLVSALLISNAFYFSIIVAAELPTDSIYQLRSKWITQDNTQLQLKKLSGKQQIVSLIYTNCLHTCPTIVSTMQEIERGLTLAEKKTIGFVLISLTPESDTPKVLKAFAEKRQLNLEHWILLSGKNMDVRSLAMALNIKYKTVENNEVEHSNLLTVLDPQGRILFQQIANIDKSEQVINRLRK